jgi:hypothetical protein
MSNYHLIDTEEKTDLKSSIYSALNRSLDVRMTETNALFFPIIFSLLRKLAHSLCT